MESKTVKIEFKDLFVTGYVGEQGNEEQIRLSINNITEMEESEYEHIHGDLTIEIGGEKLENNPNIYSVRTIENK